MLLLNFLNVLPPFKSWKLSSVDFCLLLENSISGPCGQRSAGLKGQLVYSPPHPSIFSQAPWLG